MLDALEHMLSRHALEHMFSRGGRARYGRRVRYSGRARCGWRARYGRRARYSARCAIAYVESRSIILEHFRAVSNDKKMIGQLIMNYYWG